jgi:hypothetical protein
MRACQNEDTLFLFAVKSIFYRKHHDYKFVKETDFHAQKHSSKNVLFVRNDC